MEPGRAHANNVQRVNFRHGGQNMATARHRIRREDDPESFWAALREEFSLTPDYLHFAQFFMVSHPRQVRAAIEHYRRALDENPFLAVAHGMLSPPENNLAQRACAAAAAYLGGHEREVALVPNTTTGLGLVYHGLPLGPGDEVLTTTHEHFTHHETIRLATRRVGACWRRFELVADTRRPDLDDMLRRLRAAIRPETRVLGLTWVYSNCGLRLPLRAVTALVAEFNRRRVPNRRIRVVVDGTHGFGALDESVAGTGCDYFVSSAHKWLFGPRGTGIVWAPEARWAELQPVIATYSSWDLWRAWVAGEQPAMPTAASHVSPGGFLAYEHQWALPAAFGFHQTIGRARIAERIHQLNGYLMDLLAEIPGVRLHTPRDPAWSAGIVCFDVAGMTAQEVVQGLLERRVIASVSPYAEPCARLSAGIMNSLAEVRAGADALRRAAMRRGAACHPPRRPRGAGA